LSQLRDGINIDSNSAIIAITTKSSINVNPLLLRMTVPFDSLLPALLWSNLGPPVEWLRPNLDAASASTYAQPGFAVYAIRFADWVQYIMGKIRLFTGARGVSSTETASDLPPRRRQTAPASGPTSACGPTSSQSPQANKCCMSGGRLQPAIYAQTLR
jgi:hypothetical protein